jgi:hypothetical protein
LLFRVMEGERSPVPEEVVAGEAEVSRPKAIATGSSSGGDSSDRSGDGTGGHDEESRAVDPREFEQSYDFGLSTVTVGRIRQLEARGYFIEGSTREPGEVVPDPGNDEAVVFEFFAAGLRMPPQPVLIDILLKFRVQLHHLTPNAFAQFSKYFWVVLGFGGKPSGDGFAKCYELHYQPKKVDANGVEKYQQFGCVNFHARRGEADFGHKEQLVRRVDKSVVLLQGACAHVRARGKSYVSSAFAHVQPKLTDGTPFRLR